MRWNRGCRAGEVGGEETGTRNELSSVPPKVEEERLPQHVLKPSLEKEGVHAERNDENRPECCIKTYNFRFGMGGGKWENKIKEYQGIDVS